MRLNASKAFKRSQNRKHRVLQRMGEAFSLKKNNVHVAIDLKGEEQLPMASPTQFQATTMMPIFRASPRNGRSTLYDSYELVAMTSQLNKVMVQARLNNSSPTLMTYLESPFYRHRLNSICHESARTPRRITCPLLSRVFVDRRVNGTALRGSGGFVSRLWKKVKQGLFRNKN